jgi:hypothetical protein
MLVKQQGLSEFEAWNQCSVQLVHLAKFYISIFVITCNLNSILTNKDTENQNILSDLFELFLLYDLTNNYASDFLKVRFFIERLLKLRKVYKHLFFNSSLMWLIQLR